PRATPPPARERDAATAAVSALAAHAGAWAVRVHEVRATADAVRVARAVEGAR
ncbi:dihydropteroate synthase, partial [Streptomyces sp. WAC 04229]